MIPSLESRIQKAFTALGARTLAPNTLGKLPQMNKMVNATSNYDNYFNSIAKFESAGRYDVVNKHSGALGKYQFMPQTLKGMGFDPTTFLNSPQAQEMAMRKFTEMNANIATKKGFNVNISDGIDPREGKILAGMHYGGIGYLNKLKSGSSSLNATQYYNGGRYDSLNDYSSKVSNNMMGR